MNTSTEMLFASMLYNEARSEAFLGKVAVASTVYNRLSSGKTWWGSTIEEILKHPYQYNSSTPGKVDRTSFIDCLSVIAIMEATGLLIPEITHFHSGSAKDISWTKDLELKFLIGKHYFYKEY